MNEYDEIYRDPAGPPWEIGGPQPALAAVLDAGIVRGPRVLDVGCGTGELAIALARRGYDVTGIDGSPVAIEKARANAARNGLTVRFEVQDATNLSLPDQYDAVFDSGLLHSLVRNDDAADAYLARLPDVAAPGATVFVLAVSVAAGLGWGLTEDYLRASFPAPDWTDTRVDDIEVAARSGGEDLALRGLLLRTLRRPAAT